LGIPGGVALRPRVPLGPNGHEHRPFAGSSVQRDECAGGKVQQQVTFRNVPAFAVHLDKVVEVPQLGPVKADVAYAGMFYVLSEAAPLGPRLTPDEGRDIVRISEMIKAAAQEHLPVVHPTHPEFHGVTMALLWAPPIGGKS
jgi:proline racemase